MIRRLAPAAVCIALALFAAPVAAQTPLFQQPGMPGILDPQQLEAPRKAPFTITPSLTITGEYNDNVFTDNRDRQTDFILGFTPGIAINWESPTYRLTSGYNFTSELFARERSEDHAFDRQNFWLDSFWQIDPHVRLSLSDQLIYSTDTNLISTENVSTGRDRSFANTLGAGVAWQFAPLWSLRTNGGWTAERFHSRDLLDSDVYRATLFVDREITREFTATVGYEFGFFSTDTQPDFTAHTPRVGGSWQPNPTMRLSLTGGPGFLINEDDNKTFVTPIVTATYSQRVPFGLVGLTFDRYFGTASGLGGATVNDYVGGYLTVTTLLRGLTVQAVPRYAIAKSPHGSRVDIRSFTGALYAIYRLTDVIALVGGYQYFHQRSDSTARTVIGTPIATDVDQNRLFFGVQFGYPIRFD